VKINKITIVRAGKAAKPGVKSGVAPKKKKPAATTK
jgi:hypothetical protein